MRKIAIDEVEYLENKNKLKGLKKVKEKFFSLFDKPEGKELLDTLTMSDNFAREKFDTLKDLLQQIDSNFNRREYFIVIKHLGDFHDKVEDISVVLERVITIFKEKHNEVLFNIPVDNQDEFREGLSEKLQKIQQNRQKRIKDKKDMLFGKKEASFDSLVKTAGFADWWHNLSSDRGRQLKAWEKTNPKASAQLKSEILKTINRSKALFSSLKSSLTSLADYRAKRNIDDYVILADKVVKSIVEYDRFFSKFYTEVVAPKLQLLSQTLERRKKEEETASMSDLGENQEHSLQTVNVEPKSFKEPETIHFDKDEEHLKSMFPGPSEKPIEQTIKQLQPVHIFQKEKQTLDKNPNILEQKLQETKDLNDRMNELSLIHENEMKKQDVHSVPELNTDEEAPKTERRPTIPDAPELDIPEVKKQELQKDQEEEQEEVKEAPKAEVPKFTAELNLKQKTKPESKPKEKPKKAYSIEDVLSKYGFDTIPVPTEHYGVSITPKGSDKSSIEITEVPKELLWKQDLPETKDFEDDDFEEEIDDDHHVPTTLYPPETEEREALTTILPTIHKEEKLPETEYFDDDEEHHISTLQYPPETVGYGPLPTLRPPPTLKEEMETHASFLASLNPNDNSLVLASKIISYANKINNKQISDKLLKIAKNILK